MLETMMILKKILTKIEKVHLVNWESCNCSSRNAQELNEDRNVKCWPLLKSISTSRNDRLKCLFSNSETIQSCVVSATHAINRSSWLPKQVSLCPSVLAVERKGRVWQPLASTGTRRNHVYKSDNKIFKYNYLLWLFTVVPFKIDLK